LTRQKTGLYFRAPVHARPGLADRVRAVPPPAGAPPVTELDMAGSGFTISLIPHGGRPPRQYEFTGMRLILLRVSLILAGALLVAAAFTVAAALAPGSSRADLEERVDVLEDSLRTLGTFEARMDSIEVQLEELRDARLRMENLVEAAGPVPGDSL
jgi:hypothetical protein